MQLAEKDKGALTDWTYIASSLASDFSEWIGTSEFLKQKQTDGTTYFGQTGDWVQLKTNLSNVFGESLAKYGMQLAEKDKGALTDWTYIASSLASDFSEWIGTSEFLKQNRKNVVKDIGQKGDWGQLNTNISKVFG